MGQDIVGMSYDFLASHLESVISKESCEFKSLHAKSHLQDLGFLLNELIFHKSLMKEVQFARV